MAFDIEEAEIVFTKGNGVKIDAPDLSEALWIPFKAIHEDSAVYQLGDTGVLKLHDWVTTLDGCEELEGYL